MYEITDADITDPPPSTVRADRLTAVMAALSADPRMDVVVSELGAVEHSDVSRVFRAAAIEEVMRL